MQTFLTTILPADGVFFVGVKTQTGFRNIACLSIEEMEQIARQYDAQGSDVYHACAAFKAASHVDGQGKRRQRTQENVKSVKAFWLDIDCGADKAASGKGYVTIRDAAVALQDFVQTVGLPRPWVVNSGGGLHVYWTLTEAITKEEWDPVAHQLKALTRCQAIRFLADDSRTTDVASVLRPPGSHNHKPERGGAEVSQLIEGALTPFDQLSALIGSAYVGHCTNGKRPGKNLQGATHQAVPMPETSENMARVKSALAAIDPDCERPLWRDICFAIHSLGWSCAKDLARAWSAGEIR
ncbi:hypothetical protein JCM17960_16760 [Magnetospira thiophila]